MTILPAGGADPPTRDDLRRLEARHDARLQEINARIVLHDGRFAAMGDRVNQTDRRADALSARIDSRLRSIDRRFDGAESRCDRIDDHIAEIYGRLREVELWRDSRWWRRLRRRGRARHWA